VVLRDLSRSLIHLSIQCAQQPWDQICVTFSQKLFLYVKQLLCTDHQSHTEPSQKWDMHQFPTKLYRHEATRFAILHNITQHHEETTMTQILAITNYYDYWKSYTEYSIEKAAHKIHYTSIKCYSVRTLKIMDAMSLPESRKMLLLSALNITTSFDTTTWSFSWGEMLDKALDKSNTWTVLLPVHIHVRSRELCDSRQTCCQTAHCLRCHELPLSHSIQWCSEALDHLWTRPDSNRTTTNTTISH